MEPGVRDGQPFKKKGEIPFGREAEPRWYMEVAVGMERGIRLRRIGEACHQDLTIFQCGRWKTGGKPDITLIFLRLREFDATNPRRCGKTNC